MTRFNKALYLFLILTYCFVISSCNNCPQIDNPAPDFTYNNLNGDRISLHNFKGSPIVIIIWDQGCVWCPEVMDNIQTIYDQKIIKDLVVLSINIDNDKEKNIKEYPLCKKYSFTVLHDSGGTLREKFCVRQANPILLFISRDGIYKSAIFGKTLSVDDLIIQMKRL